jgi:hypothetical protein
MDGTFKEVFNIMKKRLLITSIVMMLVVAVALSTATYAWFTSNASVTASTVTMTAATNENDSIFIKWAGGAYGASITTTKSYDGSVLKPMVPNEITVNTTTIYESGEAGEHDIAFKTAAVTTVAGDSVFDSVTDVENLIYFANNATEDATSNANTIFIKNTSAANVVGNIRVKATFTPSYIACLEGELAREGYTYYTYDPEAEEGSQYTVFSVTNDETVVTGKYKACVNLVRVAIFTRDLTAAGTNDTNTGYLLRGILANTASADTYKGIIADNQSQSTFSTTAANKIAATAGTDGVVICYDNGVAHSLAAGGEVEIRVVMWLDGEALNEKTQGAIANVALQFLAE